MRVKDENLLALFRGAGPCGWCNRWCRERHPHHLFGRGMGGAWRLDIRVNLIALGGPFDCNCHGQVHQGHIQRCDLLAVVAAREGVQQADIEAEVYRLRRERKGWAHR